MNRGQGYQDRHYRTDDSSKTGLDVLHNQEHTAPPNAMGEGGITGKDPQTVWSWYSQRAEHWDEDLVQDSNNTVEVLLIFAGLFSAVVSAFISQTYPMLKPDQSDILAAMYQEMRNPGSTPIGGNPLDIPDYAVRVNCFLFAGLFASIIVALLSILVKQWTRSYEREIAGVSSPHLRARIRHFRYEGARKWHLASIVGLLSIVMHLALFVSAVGIIDLLLSTSPVVGWVAFSVFIIGAVFFLVTTLLPLFVLDAPFRSPLSKFLSSVIRKIRRPSYLRAIRSRKLSEEEGRKQSEAEGLEDHIEQSQGKESDENSIVRAKINLDLDIICYLLSDADKSTERWLLDLCFDKLPNLRLLEEHDPQAFLEREIILEVYSFLAKGCLMVEKGKVEVKTDRLDRARRLCRFIAWYLSLPCSPETRKTMWERLTKGGDPTALPTALVQDDQHHNVAQGLAALGRIKHLERTSMGPGCSVCADEAAVVGRAFPPPKEGESVLRDEEKIKQVTQLLIMKTECLIISDRHQAQNPEKQAKEQENSLSTLQQVLQDCAPIDKDKKNWLRIIAEKEKEASPGVKNAWLKPLKTTIDGLQIKRSGSPFGRGVSFTSSVSSTGSTLQPPLNSRIASGLPNNNPPGFQGFGASPLSSPDSFSSPVPRIALPPPNPLPIPDGFSP